MGLLPVSYLAYLLLLRRCESAQEDCYLWSIGSDGVARYDVYDQDLLSQFGSLLVYKCKLACELAFRIPNIIE